MRLILVRHGETVANVEQMNSFDHDTELSVLTEKGKRQAMRAANKLKHEKIDKIFVSPQRRAMQTSEPIIKLHPEAKVIVDERVREKKFGKYGGTPYGTATAAALISGQEVFKFRPEGGESYEDCRLRAGRFFEELVKKEKGKTIMIISHGGFIKGMLLYMFNEPDENHAKFTHTNTAITIINVKDDGKHHAEIIGNADHLEGEDAN